MQAIPPKEESRICTMLETSFFQCEIIGFVQVEGVAQLDVGESRYQRMGLARIDQAQNKTNKRRNLNWGLFYRTKLIMLTCRIIKGRK